MLLSVASKLDVLYFCGFAVRKGGDFYALEGGSDQVNVLPWVGKESHRGKGDEGTHCSTVVVTWESTFSGIVVLEDCQEGWLVTNVCDFVVLEVVETPHKR
jgi:hypothetical protein